jgi:propionate CoA-transferase
MIANMALNNEIEAYCMPLGSISRMLRAAASASPGHITKVGLGTFIDPDQTGGRLNAKSTKNIVERVSILGDEYLCYKAIPINVAIIRATTGDTAGNLSFEKESLYSDARVIAMAARSSGGVVLAQVERIAEPSSLPMRTVHIPGALVDCVVLAERPEDSDQSYFTSYNPAWSGEIREPMQSKATAVLDARKIIARRAALELRPDQLVNLGIGMPEGVADVAKEENFFRFTTLTTEGGVFGGNQLLCSARTSQQHYHMLFCNCLSECQS